MGFQVPFAFGILKSEVLNEALVRDNVACGEPSDYVHLPVIRCLLTVQNDLVSVGGCGDAE